MKSLLKIATVALAILSITTARAIVLVDHSPDATGATIFPGGDGSVLQNISTGTNWGELLQFNVDVLLTGMDIYTSNLPNLAFIGQLAEIKILPNALPASVFTKNISIIDKDGVTSSPITNHVRAHVDFGANSVSILAGTQFVIGMSGKNTNLGQYGLTGPNAPQDHTMGTFNGTSFGGPVFVVGDMAFRLYGELASVPDNGTTAALLGMSIFALINIKRRIR